VIYCRSVGEDLVKSSQILKLVLCNVFTKQIAIDDTNVQI